MKIRRGYKYRLNPKSPTTRQFVRFAGACRFVWNKILAINEGRYLAGGPRLSYHDGARLLTLVCCSPQAVMTIDHDQEFT